MSDRGEYECVRGDSLPSGESCRKASAEPRLLREVVVMFTDRFRACVEGVKGAWRVPQVEGLGGNCRRGSEAGEERVRRGGGRVAMTGGIRVREREGSEAAFASM